MKIITAPEIYYPNQLKELPLFLAGGISKCGNWQNRVIEYLKKQPTTENLVVYNPRRPNFDIGNKNETRNQIAWEFGALNYLCDTFTMYFNESESDQPICFYELGRYLYRMTKVFPSNFSNYIVISVHENFKRIDDVLIQTELAVNSCLLSNTFKCNVVKSSDEHAQKIYDTIKERLLVLNS